MDDMQTFYWLFYTSFCHFELSLYFDSGPGLGKLMRFKLQGAGYGHTLDLFPVLLALTKLSFAYICMC